MFGVETGQLGGTKHTRDFIYERVDATTGVRQPHQVDEAPPDLLVTAQERRASRASTRRLRPTQQERANVAFLHGCF